MDFLYFISGVLIYLIIISLISVFVTVSDKNRAEKNKYRIRESTLMLLSALGGSFAMYAAMKKIRHKTKHMKFMIGIPAAVIIGVIAALIGRVKEIKGGEEDEASKY